MLILQIIEAMNAEKRDEFTALGNDARIYTWKQKVFALNMAIDSGVRAASKVLNIPRRTLQRWCRKYEVKIPRCPGWVFEWAERRHKQKEFWKRKGYS